ncbi:MAG: hypothetical protein SCM96_12955 [Acidobacteriota bacterium]|nr:hypothetical protein [Acidobacteriota bacterium]
MKIRTPVPALGITGLMTLAAAGGLTLLPPEAPQPTSSLTNVFARTEESASYTLKYGWKDFKGTSRTISFDIDKDVLASAEKEFGYRQEDLDRHLEAWSAARNEEMIADLKALVRFLIDEGGHGEYIILQEKGPLEFTLKLSVPFDIQDRVKPAYDAIRIRLADEYASASKKIEAGLDAEKTRYLVSRGLASEGKAFRVDYPRSVRNNTPRVRHVLEVLRAIDEKLNIRDFLGLSLSFIQHILYRVPPTVEDGKVILGFWTPPRVLVDNLGDCDSKAVAFASIWLNFKKYPVVLIRVPEHMFVGVAVPSWETGGLTINGLRYTLCEVSPNKRVPPGQITYYSSTYLNSGRYRYEIVSD